MFNRLTSLTRKAYTAALPIGLVACSSSKTPEIVDFCSKISTDRTDALTFIAAGIFAGGAAASAIGGVSKKWVPAFVAAGALIGGGLASIYEYPTLNATADGATQCAKRSYQNLPNAPTPQP